MHDELIDRRAMSAHGRCERFLADVVAETADERERLRAAWLAGFDERTRVVREQALAPMPNTLTPMQRRVLEAFAAAVDLGGFNPTMVELAGELGVSKVTIFEHFGQLVRKGCLRRRVNCARAYSLAVLVPVPATERTDR